MAKEVTQAELIRLGQKALEQRERDKERSTAKNEILAKLWKGYKEGRFKV